MSRVPRVVRNDWSSLAVPSLAGWRPTLAVSVVVPAYESQDTVDVLLAALAGQTYPAELLEVIIVDDGSEPPLRLPPIRPAHTTLLRVTQGWGKTNALRTGVAHAGGQILHLLDADMVLYPDHIAAHARWHHLVPYAVTLGYKRFVDLAAGQQWPDAQRVEQTWRAGEPDSLFGGEPGAPHEYQERYFAQTDQLRAADHLAFRITVGMSMAVRRELYDAAGGPLAGLRFGNDTEFGYRLAQAGAVFIPEPEAKAWHLGLTHVMLAERQIARYRLAWIADLVPIPRTWRRVGGTAWSVPLVEVVMTVGDESLERVRAVADSVLRAAERDLRLTLVGPWDSIDTGRVPALSDPQLDLRLIAATYRGEPRVRLATQLPPSAFPAPYLLELAPTHALAPDAIGRLIDLADRHRAGALQLRIDGGADGTPAPRSSPPAGTAAAQLWFWRTAAVGRARWVRGPQESLSDAVAAVHGCRTVDAGDVGLVDLRSCAPAELAAGLDPRWLADQAKARPRSLGLGAPTLVEVEGVRSLARATLVVAGLGARRVKSWLRRVMLRHIAPRKG